MKRSAIAAILVACVLGGTGGAPAQYAQSDRKHSPGETPASAMTKDDVVALSRANIGDDIIISQIRASRTVFQLTTEDILDLADAGVREKVIEAMIRTEEKRGRQYRRPAGYYYPRYYPAYPLVHPWYPSSAFGFSFGHRPFFVHHRFHPHFGLHRHRVFHFGGGFSGHRPFGSHR